MSTFISFDTMFPNFSFFIFFILSVSLCCIILTVSYFLGSRSNARHKNKPFESGIDSIGFARLRFSVKFYLIAIFFVIFDVESLYLLAWSVSVRENSWSGFIEATVFISILYITLIYLRRVGALDWKVVDSHKFINKN